MGAAFRHHCNQIGRFTLAAMTDSKPFEKPVVVELGHVGKYRQISSTREAAECLMTVWPLNRGQRHRDALDTCLKALEGYRSTADARRALIEAAEESEVLVPEERLSDGKLH
ncbi:DUF982 domain-containing protein [Mesorhizobium sp. P16.1]|nr:MULTISPECIES: DUF982 domain-containing protein [unclassified Mesorhizobium]MCT2577666.1 DUF982 domain-containing protein [Mesorhizobium sp. P13.3]WIE89230.1 DUF982 domain-containing protein [Mesorhizobium sp. WSM4875]MDF3166604.1 DUF982 domain-containing protein [Mesorhizobium sp. P16.1]MDF3179392.1 DUF982 domain-containing protein [Mesorhizobium sp. P17.1]MDF3183284.1 DUF982 domain-containing protein [Mesorhizobium sp. ICCV3110.1]